MTTPLNPQQVYFIESFCSPEYLKRMRDAWRNTVEVIERALANYMSNLPSNYRSRHLSEQPDMSWGMTVLPNFRSTLRDVEDGYQRVKHGDLLGVRYCGNIRGDISGQGRDYSPEWMTKQEEAEFDKWSHEAATLYFPLEKIGSVTISEGQFVDADEWDYYQIPRPKALPRYKLNTLVRIKTGDKIPQSGIYLPHADNCAAQLLLADPEWPEAPEVEREVYDPATDSYATVEVPTIWTLIEREPGEGVSFEPTLFGQPRIRVEGGHPCPKEGWYITPAMQHSRRRFKVGEIMPIAENSDYGATIWQWDVDQS